MSAMASQITGVGISSQQVSCMVSAEIGLIVKRVMLYSDVVISVMASDAEL